MHHPMNNQYAHARHRQPIICPVHHCVMDNYFVENQDYIHPTHLLIQNHHLLNNYHYFPYMVSESNDYQVQDYAYPQGIEPQGYNWMGNMPEMGQIGTGQPGQGPMPMMPQGQMPR